MPLTPQSHPMARLWPTGTLDAAVSRVPVGVFQESGCCSEMQPDAGELAALGGGLKRGLRGGRGSGDAGPCGLGWQGIELLVEGVLLHPAQASLVVGVPKKMKHRKRQRHGSLATWY